MNSAAYDRFSKLMPGEGKCWVIGLRMTQMHPTLVLPYYSLCFLFFFWDLFMGKNIEKSKRLCLQNANAS